MEKLPEYFLLNQCFKTSPSLIQKTHSGICYKTHDKKQWEAINEVAFDSDYTLLH